jgi:hypothetical protein
MVRTVQAIDDEQLVGTESDDLSGMVSTALC